MIKTKSFVPALRWNFLTPFYDALLRWVMQEERFKTDMICLAKIKPGQRVMDEVHRVLRTGGQFLILDFGQPVGGWSRLVSPVMARLEAVEDNHQGLLPGMMAAARFVDVSVMGQYSSVFGTLYLYRGFRGAVLA